VVESIGPWYRLNPVRYESAYFSTAVAKVVLMTRADNGIPWGADEYAAFIECFGRAHGARGVAESALQKRNLVRITSARPLVLADLTGNGLAAGSRR